MDGLSEGISAYLAKSAMGLGESYIEIGAYVNPILAVVDVGIDYNKGEASGWELAMALLPGKAPNIRRVPDIKPDVVPAPPRTSVPIAGKKANVADREAANIATAPKLASQLRMESARSPFTSVGQLTPQVIKDSRMIIPNSQIGNPGVPAGYNKYSTPTFQSPSGEFQAHFYMNPKTGKVLYDLDCKVKFNR